MKLINIFKNQILALGLLITFLTLIPGIYPLKFTNEEKAALERLKPIAAQIVFKDFMKEDRYLIRFLRARDLNVNRTADMLRQVMKWRRDDNIDNILKEDYSVFDDNFKVFYPGMDKQGRPVLISLFGMYDVRKFALSGRMPQVYRYFNRLLELSERYFYSLLEKTRNEDLDGPIFIIDMSGFNLRKQACFLCLTAIPHLFQSIENYYPGYFHRVFLLNTPSIFFPVLNIVKPILSNQTSSILQVFGHDKENWKSVLLQHVNPDQLPMQYGGNKVLNLLKDDWRKNPDIANLLEGKSDSEFRKNFAPEPASLNATSLA